MLYLEWKRSASDWLYIFALEVENIIVATVYLNIIPNITRKASPYAIIENVVTVGHFRKHDIIVLVNTPLHHSGDCKGLEDFLWEATTYLRSNGEPLCVLCVFAHLCTRVEFY